MIAADGYNVMDDVGGISGYVRFLKDAFGRKKEEAGTSWTDSDSWDDEELAAEEDPENLLDWADYMGWKKRMPNLKTWF